MAWYIYRFFIHEGGDHGVAKKFMLGLVSKAIFMYGRRYFSSEDRLKYSIQWISSTENNYWNNSDISFSTKENIKPDIIINENICYQTMDETPWGGCFADRGYMAEYNFVIIASTMYTVVMFHP